MPWCDDCDHFYTPSTLSTDGTCPEGHQVVDPDEVDAAEKLPWHFWLLVIALVAYLGWRAIQGLGWIFG